MLVLRQSGGFHPCADRFGLDSMCDRLQSAVWYSVATSPSQRASLLRVNQQGCISPRLQHLQLDQWRPDGLRFPTASPHNAEAQGMPASFATLQLPDVAGGDTCSLSGGRHLSAPTQSAQVTAPTHASLVLALINCDVSCEWSHSLERIK